MLSGRKPQEITVPQVRFQCEQDGTPERLLKARLADVFRCERKVLRAYLARADFGSKGEECVVLAVRSYFGPDREIVNEVAAMFASVFGTQEHLDIMFLTDRQEVELVRVCKPFFEQG